jgi:Putative zinc-finger
MYGENKNEMQCSEFDLLLTESIDGQLTGDKLDRFEKHKASCASCSAMFADVTAGVNWLSQVGDVEPPKHLLHNILVATSGVTETAAAKAERHEKLSFRDRLRETLWPVLAPVFTARFATTAAGAFFAITVTLAASGVKLSHIEFTTKGLSRTYYATEARAVKYYENIRLVYEIESRVNDLRRAAGTDQDSGGEKKQKKDQNNKSQESEPERHEQNYSRRSDELIEANLDNAGIGIIARQRRVS